MTKPSNIEGIEKATGRSWAAWVERLKAAGADNLPHPEIAALVRHELGGKIDSVGWWAQGITVAYEQHIGRRKPGQVSDGSFETSVTRTIAGTKEDVFALWREAYDHTHEFDGMAIKNVRTSVTPVRSYWRGDFVDTSRLSVAVEQKQSGKAIIAVTHSKLKSSNEKDTWRAYWKNTLDKL